MAITRSPMVDDDGSGTTGTIINNAWKTELYNQIDGLGARTPFTPIDGSGAGLAFVINAANWGRVGNMVQVVVNMTYPANSNGAAAVIGGVPYGPAYWSGFYGTYPPHRIYHLDPGGYIYVFNSGGGQMTNAELSGAAVSFAGVYFAV